MVIFHFISISHGDFVTIIDLGEGTHQCIQNLEFISLKFVVYLFHFNFRQIPC